MDTPFLFESEASAKAANDKNEFSARAILRFGESARCFSGDYRMWPPIENPKCHAVWRNALAAEALLFSPGQRVNRLPFGGLLTDDTCPCGADAPPYGELKAHPAAAALFPMSGDQPRPGRIWAVGKGNDGLLPPERAFALEEADGVLAEADERGIRLYAEGCKGCEGQSWQLAANLAMDALESGDLGYRIDLAAEWLVTGEVRARRVWSVGIKNKPKLGLNTRRRWLLPESNIESFRRTADKCGLKEPSVTGARTLGDAIETVRGCIARRRLNEPWPREVACLHVAVAADPSPVLRLLELTRPRELHLWPLGKHPDVAEGLNATLREEFPRLKVKTHDGVSADALDEISLALHNHFGTAEWVGDTLFDVTAGSWLFRVGVEGVARRMGVPYVCQMSDTCPYVKIWHERGVTQYCQMLPADARPTLTKAAHSCQSRTVPPQDTL